MLRNRHIAQSIAKPLTAALIATLALASAAAPAYADDSEIMDGADTGWMNQAPQQGNRTTPRVSQESANNWGTQQQYAAPQAGFQCPSGWSCTPKVAQQKEEESGCSSRFSRCYRKKMGLGSGGGGDD